MKKFIATLLSMAVLLATFPVAVSASQQDEPASSDYVVFVFEVDLSEYFATDETGEVGIAPAFGTISRSMPFGITYRGSGRWGIQGTVHFTVNGDRNTNTILSVTSRLDSHMTLYIPMYSGVRNQRVSHSISGGVITFTITLDAILGRNNVHYQQAVGRSASFNFIPTLQG
jgi:hypothetical protein